MDERLTRDSLSKNIPPMCVTELYYLRFSTKVPVKTTSIKWHGRFGAERIVLFSTSERETAALCCLKTLWDR